MQLSGPYKDYMMNIQRQPKMNIKNKNTLHLNNNSSFEDIKILIDQDNLIIGKVIPST